jgi:hypothetical protein
MGLCTSKFVAGKEKRTENNMAGGWITNVQCVPDTCNGSNAHIVLRYCHMRRSASPGDSTRLFKKRREEDDLSKLPAAYTASGASLLYLVYLDQERTCYLALFLTLNPFHI